MLKDQSWFLVTLPKLSVIFTVKRAENDANSMLEVSNENIRNIQQDYGGLYSKIAPRGAGKSIRYKDNTWISLINATPYRWHKGHAHSYQLSGWEIKWPEYIESGESVSVEAKRLESFRHWDSAAEVIYHLENTTEPMSFQVQYRSGRIHNIWVQYMEELHTVNNEKHSEHRLGFHRSPGGVGFVLAGDEKRFYSNDPPIGWMQSQLDAIGNLSLREIMLPRSHHAGMWKNKKTVGVGIPFNTQTHRTSLYNQIAHGGVRVLDFRPAKDGEKFHESHGSKIAGAWNGMLGASLDEMIDHINKFNDKYPGELIVWDIHPTDAWNTNRAFRHLNGVEKAQLYEKLKTLKYRVAVPETEDVSEWPINKFIGNKTSAVLIRVDESWIVEDGFPGGKEGFISGHNFPLRHHWSNTNKGTVLLKDQVENLVANRNQRSNEVYVSDWLLTQKGIGVVIPLDSIMKLAQAAWRMMYHELWDALTENMYPNWLALDDIHGNQPKSFVMAVNYCLAARQCGTLGGKVKSLEGH